MFNRTKFFVKNFSNSEILIPKFKYRCVKCVFIQRIEYAQVVSGRCISVRKKGQVKSLVIRNKKYGTEARFIINNPRFIMFKLSPSSTPTRGGWDSNPRILSYHWLSKPTP
jgi:hypothetical protein